MQQFSETAPQHQDTLPATHHCRDCGWQGPEPDPLSAGELARIVATLRGGDRVPSGRCPHCDAAVIPATIEDDVLLAGTHNALLRPSVVPWNLRIERIGDAYAVVLSTQDGQGCEIMLDIEGSRPRLKLSTWDTPAEAATAEPVATLKAGSGHVVARTGQRRHAPLIYFTGDHTAATLPVCEDSWRDLDGWSDPVPTETGVTEPSDRRPG